MHIAHQWQQRRRRIAADACNVMSSYQFPIEIIYRWPASAPSSLEENMHASITKMIELISQPPLQMLIYASPDA